MKRIGAIGVLILALILFLPLLGVDQFGSLIEGPLGWITAIAVLVIAIIEIKTEFMK